MSRAICLGIVALHCIEVIANFVLCRPELVTPFPPPNFNGKGKPYKPVSLLLPTITTTTTTSITTTTLSMGVNHLY